MENQDNFKNIDLKIFKINAKNLLDNGKSYDETINELIKIGCDTIIAKKILDDLIPEYPSMNKHDSGLVLEVKPTREEKLIKKIFPNYKKIIQQFILNKPNSFLYFVIWLLGVYFIIKKNTWFIPIYNPNPSVFHNWFYFWTISVFMGIISGIILYWIGGILFQFLVWFSGGKSKIYVSRRIYLYTGLPVIIISILTALIQSFVYGKFFFSSSTAPDDNLNFIFNILGIVASFVTLALVYFSVRIVQKTRFIRTLIIFILFPIMLYFGFSIFFANYENIMQWANRLDNKITKNNISKSGNKYNNSNVYNNNGIYFKLPNDWVIADINENEDKTIKIECEPIIQNSEKEITVEIFRNNIDFNELLKNNITENDTFGSFKRIEYKDVDILTREFQKRNIGEIYNFKQIIFNCANKSVLFLNCGIASKNNFNSLEKELYTIIDSFICE